MLAVLMLGLVLVVWAVLARPAQRYSVTVPIAMAAAGLILTNGTHPLVDVEVTGPIVRHLIEITLALVLFTDATEISMRWLRETGRVPMRMIFIAFPLTVLLGFAAGVPCCPARAGGSAPSAPPCSPPPTPPRSCRCCTTSACPPACATPSPSSAASTTASPHPRTAAAGRCRRQHRPGERPARTAHRPRRGPAHRLRRVADAQPGPRARLDHPEADRVGMLALAITAFAMAEVLHGNGFVAAFVAGLAARATAPHMPHAALQTVSDTATVLSAAVWFVFGSLIVPAFMDGLEWRVFAYAFLSLTLIRMLPVALSLLGSHVPWRERWALGFWGPRGLDSMVLGIIALEQLSGLDADWVADVVVVVISLSILIHGLSARYFASWWDRRSRALAGSAGPSTR
ncbi:cation:proton antiporter [Catellatospora coxensis]